MSFLDIPADQLDNVKEPGVLRTEEEVKIAITDVKVAENKHGDPYMLTRFAVLGVEDVKTFTKYFALPCGNMEAEKKNNALRTLKYFYVAFEINYADGVEIEDLIGAEGWAFIGVDEQEDTDYGPQNYVKKFIKS